MPVNVEDHSGLPAPAPKPASAELPPVVVEVLAPLMGQLVNFINSVAAPVLVQAREQLHQALTPANDWLRTNGPRIIEVALTVKRTGAEIAFPNWDALDTEEEWLAALRLVRRDDGVPLVWVPPAPVVKALVAAEHHEARDEVLLARARDIATHAQTGLGDVTHPDLLMLRDGIQQGWRAFESGLHVSAQTTASSAVGEILLQRGHRHFRPFKQLWKEARDSDPIAFGLDELRLTSVMVAVSTAIQDDREVSTLRGFDRHATAHGMQPQHYSEVNALRGLMLVTSAARELQFVLADEWMQPRSGSLPAVRVGRIAAVSRTDV